MLFLLIALAGSGLPDSTPRQRLDALLTRYLAAGWLADPEGATLAGIHRYDSLSTDRSQRAAQADVRRAQETLAALRRLDTTRLDAQSKVDWLLFESELVRATRSAAEHYERRMPANYIPFDGVYALLERGELGPDARTTAAAARLQRWPDAFAWGRRQLAHPPRLWTELAIGNADGILRYLREDAPAKGSGTRYQAAVKTAATALDAYARWIRDTLLPASDGSWVAGADYYNFLLRHSKLLPYTADELIALGNEVMTETEDSLAALARWIDPHRTWRELADSSKSLHPSADSVLVTYAAAENRARRFIVERGLFDVPPGETLAVVLTPPNLRNTYAYGGYDGPGPFEQRKAGRFFVTPVEPGMTPEQVASKLRGHNFGWITVVSLHEGYPGHHLQTVYAQANPSLFRRVFSSEVYTEGWALYAEELMYQNGFYPTPLARLTQLRMRLWRAARVVIDPSIHTGRMTYDEAVQFFVSRVGLERADAEAELNRYTTWPTQAISYIVGMREIERLRDELRRELGARFDLKEFHRLLLEQGSLPPLLMRRAVRAAYGIEVQAGDD